MSSLWPSPPFEIALVEPEIPPNTGNIARLCAATGTPLHLVGPLGFRLYDRDLKRAGLDYWDHVAVTRHDDLPAFERVLAQKRFFLFSTRGTRPYTEANFESGDMLVFGSETRGLPAALLERYPETLLTIPMMNDKVRSLNLANTAAIVLYEALRQTRSDSPA